MSAWLRWLSALFGSPDEALGPGTPGSHGEIAERVFHLRTRIHCGYY